MRDNGFLQYTFKVNKDIEVPSVHIYVNKDKGVPAVHI